MVTKKAKFSFLTVVGLALAALAFFCYQRFFTFPSFIITREKPFLIESIEVGNVNQWRGGKAPWSPD